MDSINYMVKKVLDAIRKDSKKKTIGYDATGTVKRIEGNIAWVHFDNGVDETPINKSINCKKGDKVRVRVSNGSAFLVGNDSAPPTDDTKAEHAQTTAEVAEKTAQDAQTTASEAVETAEHTSNYFWHVDGSGAESGAHVTEIPQKEFEENPSGGNLLMQSDGISIRDGQTSLSLFGAEGARIGKENGGHITLTNNSFSIYGENTGAGFAVTNTTSTESDTVRDTIITRRNYGGVGTYTHTLKGYISGLSISIAFSDPSGNITPISCTKTIPLSSFGSWSINSSDTGFSATGSVSYDSINKVVTLQVLTMTGQTSYRLTGFYATYTAYPQLATVSVGQNVDLSDKEIAFAVGHNTGNAFYVKRNGNVYANAIGVDSNLNVNNELNARVYRGTTETISISDSDFTTTTGSITSVDLIRFGNVVQLTMQVTNTGAVAAGTNSYAGTLNLTGYRPIVATECASYSGSVCVIGVINTDGSIIARVVGAQLPANRVPRLTFTYLI